MQAGLALIAVHGPRTEDICLLYHIRHPGSMLYAPTLQRLQCEKIYFSMLCVELLESVTHETIARDGVLENYDLLEAITVNKPIVFKIELNARTHIFRKQGRNTTLSPTTDVNISAGTVDEFLIWIKCKDLDQVAIDTNDIKCCNWERIYFKSLLL